MARPRTRPAGQRAGFTLVELMVVVAILSVLVAIALPSARDFVARKRLEGIAQELATDLRLLKSNQIQNRPLSGTSINFGSAAGRLCYILYARGNGRVEHCNCGLSAETMCGAAGAFGRPVPIRQVDIPTSTGITLTATPSSLTVDGYNGLPRSNPTIRISLSRPGAGEIVVSTNPAGMTTVCSVSGAFGAIRPCAQ